ncbi:TPA: hypothetical protein QDB06_004444 [Burkholderia vietnamiensis]|nr:hypothetical protein [Burkholderia vietnamiensis]
MLLVTPEAVAAVMELQPVPHTLAELEALVRDDLPKSAPSLPSSSGSVRRAGESGTSRRGANRRDRSSTRGVG